MNSDKILPKPLPDHIAIIMDGNGRWARKNPYQELQVIEKE